MAKAAEARTDASAGMIVIKAAPRDTKPPVRRRSPMPRSLTLGDRHPAIQAAMDDIPPDPDHPAYAERRE